MKKSGMVAALVVGTVLTGYHSIAAESTSPPTDLKLVGDHWTPWDPPAAGPDAYITPSIPGARCVVKRTAVAM